MKIFHWGNAMVSLGQSYMDKNLSQLKKYHPQAFEMVNGYQKQIAQTTLIFAENQKPNLKVKTTEDNWVFIHNHADPGSEASVFLSLVPEDSTGVVIMFGMGLGYSVLELLRKRKKIQFLLIFELNVDFFIQALKNMDLAELLTDMRVILCLEKPGDLPALMAPANKAFMLEDIHTLNLQSCFHVNPDYEKISSKVFDYINVFNSEGSTKIAHGKTFFENRLKHLTSMHHDKKLEDLAGIFKGVPALIIAAGPSLDKNIDQIARAVGKAVIICVDTALSNLLSHGIKPDFVTSIDYQELTYEKISNAASNPDCRQINLICTSWVTAIVPKTFPAKNVYWAYADTALENWINVSMEGRKTISGAGTVAHLNFISAITMGCDPVIFVGQDLAFSSSKWHSSNVVLSNDEAAKKILDNGEDVLWVEGLVEPQVSTNRQMLGYKRGFEQMIKSESGVRTINSTEGGALIEGAENMPLAQAIKDYCVVDMAWDKLCEHNQVDLLGSVESTLKRVEKLEKVIVRADKLVAPIQKELAKLKRKSQKATTFSYLPLKLRKKISTFDSLQKESDQDPMWPIFDELTMEGLRQNERERKEIESLEGIPAKYLDWLLRSVVRVGWVNKIRINNLGWFKGQLDELASYYKKENSGLEKLREQDHAPNDILDLATLYYDSQNYVLLEKILNQYAPELKKKARFYYYSGIIALNLGDYETAEDRFQSALKIDESYGPMIVKSQNEKGDYYLKLSTSLTRTFKGYLNSIVEFLLLKGLECCPDHMGIHEEFSRFARNGLDMIKQNHGEAQGNDLELNKTVLSKWIDLFAKENKILGCLEKNTVYSFYLLYGKILVDEAKYQQAVDNLQILLSVMPGHPDVYISLADIHFAVGSFDSGLQYLKQAVGLDKKYGVYWYNMAKNLRAQEDYNGAILAYEQYFLAMPENISALRDIGDCHKTLGNLEAARKSYEEFKKLLEK